MEVPHRVGYVPRTHDEVVVENITRVLWPVIFRRYALRFRKRNQISDCGPAEVANERPSIFIPLGEQIGPRWQELKEQELNQVAMLAAGTSSAQGVGATLEQQRFNIRYALPRCSSELVDNADSFLSNPEIRPPLTQALYFASEEFRLWSAVRRTEKVLDFINRNVGATNFVKTSRRLLMRFEHYRRERSGLAFCGH